MAGDLDHLEHNNTANLFKFGEHEWIMNLW